MASPAPREPDEELVSAGSEPGTCGCGVERAGWEGGRRPEPPLGLGGWWVKADLVGEGGRSSEDKRDEPEKSCTLVETLQNCLRSQLSSREQANLGDDVDQITCLTEEETEAWAWGWGGRGRSCTYALEPRPPGSLSRCLSCAEWVLKGPSSRALAMSNSRSFIWH